MPTIATLAIKLLADATGLRQQFDSAGQQVSEGTKKLQQRSMGKITEGFSTQTRKNIETQTLLGSPELVRKQAQLNLRGTTLEAQKDRALTAATDKLKFGETMGPMVTQMNSLGSSAMAAAGPLAIAGGVIAGMVALAGKASPAGLNRLSTAFDDAMAAAGTAFLPVLDAVTVGVRLLGDVFATLAPGIEPILTILTDLWKELFAEIGGLANTFLPMIVSALQFFAKALSWVVFILKWLPLPMNALMFIAKGINFLTGGKEGAGGLKSSVGMAPGKASFTGLEEFGAHATIAALESGGAKSVEEEQLDVLKEIRDGKQSSIKEGNKRSLEAMPS